MCGTVPGRVATSIGLDVYEVMRPQLRKHMTCDMKPRSSFHSKGPNSSVLFCFILEYKWTDPFSSDQMLFMRNCPPTPLPISPGDLAKACPVPAVTSQGRDRRDGDGSLALKSIFCVLHKPVTVGFLLYRHKVQEMLK